MKGKFDTSIKFFWFSEHRAPVIMDLRSWKKVGWILGDFLTSIYFTKAFFFSSKDGIFKLGSLNKKKFFLPNFWQ